MQSPWSHRTVLGVFVLALFLRGGYLIYNRAVNPESTWTWQARAALHGARLLGGDYSPTADVTGADADFMFHNGVNGQTYLHLALQRVCGHTSYLRMQVLQLGLDALLTLPVMLIGFLLHGPAVARWSGLVYAAFVPQWWLAVVPGYDFWASFGFIVATSLMMWGRHCLPARRAAGLMFLLCGGVTAGLAATVRPTVLLYPIAWGALLVLLGAVPWRLKLGAAVALACGMAAGYAPVLVHNHFVHGGVLRAPSVSIHQFWCGVGQYPNPYGVTDDDGSVKAFYERLTGRPGPLLQYSADYVTVLKQEARAYIAASPAHYARCVLQRCGLFLSGVGLRQARLDADIWKQNDAIQDRRRERERLTAEYGTVGGTARYALAHPADYAWYPFLLLPAVGFVIALVGRHWRAVALAGCPLLYSAALAAPFYYCERCVISAYAAVVPVWVFGVWRACGWVSQWRAGRQLPAGTAEATNGRPTPAVAA